VGRYPAALGFLIAARCSCLFASLAAGVLSGGPLVRFDRSAARALYAHASEAPGLTAFFRIVTALCSLEALVGLGLLVAVALLVRRRWSPLVAWLVAVLGGEALNLLLKNLIARPQPHLEHPLPVEVSYSFPSGQAMESLVVYGMLVYFAVLASSGRGKARFSSVVRPCWLP
jgi:membrane-associated phospholipid phosphatase